MITYSFVIPHKNTPDLLQRCLNSIPQRNDVEVIIVDNNSSPDIVDFEHYPGGERNDVTIIKDNNSIGAGGVRNTGLSQAKGKWVLFADADDYYNLEIINTLDKYKDTDAEVIYFNHQVEKNGIIIKNPYPYIDRYYGNDLDAVKYKHTVPWNKMVKRAFLFRNHISFEDCPVGNDIFYSYQVGYFSKKVIVEKRKIYNYVINAESTIHRKKNNEKFYVTLFKHHYQCNEFVKFIGHTEWKRTIVHRIAAIYDKRGFRQTLLAIKILFSQYNSLRESKYDYVNSIKERKNA